MSKDPHHTEPLVSVALCTFNGEAHLREQLESIIGQSYTNMEIIAVDDHSSDDTFSLLKEYGSRDPRLRFFQNELNLGYTRNFEKALSLTRGEWIAFADQDDIWHKDKIRQMLSRWNGRSGLIYCSSKKFENPGAIDFSDQHPFTRGINGSNPSALACKNCTEGHTLLVHQSLKPSIAVFPTAYYDWWIGMVASVKSGIQWIEKILVWRRIHGDNASENKFLVGSDMASDWIAQLQVFVGIEGIDENDRAFLQQCIDMYNNKATSREWFRFIYKHRKTFFYYKRSGSWLSYYKHARRLSKKLSKPA